MLVLCQLKSQIRDLSMSVEKMGGYMIDCHMVADERIDFRPKKRNRSVGLCNGSKHVS